MRANFPTIPLAFIVIRNLIIGGLCGLIAGAVDGVIAGVAFAAFYVAIDVGLTVSIIRRTRKVRQN